MKITTKINSIELRRSFVCPYDHHKLLFLSKNSEGKKYVCTLCKREYPLVNKAPNFLPDGLREWTTNQYRSNKTLSKKSESMIGKWKPGFRGWSPNCWIKILSFGVGEGRITPIPKGSLLDV